MTPARWLAVRGGGFVHAGPVIPNGRSELGGRIARDPRVTHHPGLAVVVRSSPVEHTAIVPDDHVTRTPPMRIGSGRPAGEVDEVGQELLRFGLAEAGNAVGVTSDEEGGATRDRVDLDERAKRCALRMKTVGGSLLHHVTDPGLGVVERVVSREPRDAPAR